MPDKTPSSVAQCMLNLIDHELNDIQATVLGHRKSDSYSTISDPDSDLSQEFADAIAEIKNMKS